VVRCFLFKNPNNVIARENTTLSTPLNYAARYGHFDIIKQLIATAKELKREGTLGMTMEEFVNWKDVSWYRPLYLASCYGHTAYARLLLDNGACINCCSTLNGETPLVGAIRSGSVDCVRLLLERNASVGPFNKLGETPLSVAESQGNQEICALLREYVERSNKEEV